MVGKVGKVGKVVDCWAGWYNADERRCAVGIKSCLVFD